jgi:hypothetical protein
MSHSMSLSLDLSDHLLAAQREIHYLHTRLVDTEGDPLPCVLTRECRLARTSTSTPQTRRPR